MMLSQVVSRRCVASRNKNWILSSSLSSPSSTTRRLMSKEVSSGTAEAEASAAAEATTTPTITRHGPGDGVIKLNVGGKEFLTLRSTVESNQVLREYIRRAEANGEVLTDGGNSVFIDRDPKHFGLILCYLRNKAEGISYNAHMAMGSGAMKLHKKPKFLRLPKNDPGALEDLYVEAQHYQMQALQDHVCGTSFITRLFSFVGGTGSNPFQAASNFLLQARRSFLGLVGTGSIISVLQQEIDWMGLNIKLPTFDKKEGKDKGGTSSAEKNFGDCPSPAPQ